MGEKEVAMPVRLPGRHALQARITDSDRSLRGDHGAINDVLCDIRKKMEMVLDAYHKGSGASLHIGVTVTSKKTPAEEATTDGEEAPT